MTSSTFEEMDYREGFAGGCYHNGTAICVAKPEEYCDEETFVPAHFLRSNGGHPLRYCAGDLEDVIIGRCVSSSGGINGKCTNLQSRCKNNSDNEEEEDQNITSSFIAYDPTCTITQDLQQLQNNDNDGSSTTTSLSYVTYGKCGDRCVWSPNDCIDEEMYIPNDEECTADKVQIGACFAGHAFCAVDSSSCTQPNRPNEPFWTHQEVRVKIGANCFLSSLPVSVPVPVPTVGTVSSNIDETATATATGTTTTTTTATNSAFGGEENLTSGNNNTNNRLNTGTLVAIVTVVAIVVGVAIGIIGTVRFSKKRKKDDTNTWIVDNSNKQPPATLPIEDIEIMSSTNHKNNNNNNMMDNVDANSDLSEENYIVN